MNKRQVISSLNNIAEELDNNGLYVEASSITKVMKKVAQMEAQPDTKRDILKMIDGCNLTYIWNDLRTGNPVKQEYIDAVMKVKNDVTTLSSILPYYLNKPL